MKQIPIYDASAAIACTITEGEIPERIALIERMRGNLVRLERVEHGMLLHFPARPGIEADLRQFAVDEKRCCEFWGFDVIASDDGLGLRWEAPPQAAELIDRLGKFFLGDEPASALAGLL